MAVAARHLSAIGVALVGVGAIAFTPVGPTLEALNLRTESVPPLEASQLPDWVTGGAVDPGGQIGVFGSPPRSVTANQLPGPGAAVNTAVAGFDLTAIDDGTTVLPAAGPAAAADPLIDLADGFELPVEGALAPLIAVVNDLLSAVDVVAVVSALVTDAKPIVDSVANVPIAIGSQLIASAAAVVAALVTFSPLAVLTVLGQALVDLAAAAIGALTGVADAVDIVSPDVPVAASNAQPAPALTHPATAEALIVTARAPAPTVPAEVTKAPAHRSRSDRQSRKVKSTAVDREPTDRAATRNLDPADVGDAAKLEPRRSAPIRADAMDAPDTKDQAATGAAARAVARADNDNADASEDRESTP